MADIDWLPELELFTAHGGDWTAYLEVIYRVFYEDFVVSPPRFRGKRLGLKRRPISEGKECTFWHLTSEGAVEDERTPDFRRCERIRWPAPFITNSEDTVLKVWAEPDGNKQKIFIWLESERYLVILADRGEYILPWTAYCVERDHQCRKYNKRYERYKGVQIR